MYKQYFNAYEKRAEEIRKAARAVETQRAGSPPIPPVDIRKDEIKPQKPPAPSSPTQIPNILERFRTDDILLLGLIFLLMGSEEKDMTLIVILGYLFLSGL